MSSTKQDEATTTANVNGAQPNMPMAESGILGQLVVSATSTGREKKRRK
jgi:hypothetical protein